MKRLSLEQMVNVNGGKQWTLESEIKCGIANIAIVVSIGTFSFLSALGLVLYAIDKGCYERVEGVPY
jgi:hypothetical protein